MHDSAFRERRRMRPLEWRVGRLGGYRLHFNLDGTPKGRTAPANICADADAEVWGVLYRITRKQMVRLNLSEGVPGGMYRPTWSAWETSMATWSTHWRMSLPAARPMAGRRFGTSGC